jgi:hypothetical protein
MNSSDKNETPTTAHLLAAESQEDEAMASPDLLGSRLLKGDLQGKKAQESDWIRTKSSAGFGENPISSPYNFDQAQQKRPIRYTTKTKRFREKLRPTGQV